MLAHATAHQTPQTTSSVQQPFTETPHEFTDEQPHIAPRPTAHRLPVQVANPTVELFRTQMPTQPPKPASVPFASASATTQPLQPDPPPPLQRLEPILRATPIARDARPQDDTQLHQRQKQAVPVDRQPALPNRNFKLQLKSARHLGRRVNLETQITPLLRNHPDVQSAISLA
ncbi:hypothetical protein NW754_005022 [Fusarium falciforme]|uniref:Uncharacterized protein n=1 Tax=Fusarium falciforme TaxID=195108 RepID=A0A9W8V673_9HYPO|nr:hypothetical protein NW754_005022 [Fusarium falciforme]KAJ4194821.1 hypothetical protein NW755_002239 [Fusarium falciforme]KAJ4208709.1 hypothetical protein NW767_001818 [Fusarium falciforme]KAJ4243955.1 hypothetical protein NW757_010887 [Fusarium falciforme]